MLYRVRTSINESERATKLARMLVEARASVSVHIRPCASVYQWKGEIKEEKEYELDIITSRPNEVERIIKGAHPYEVPEIVKQEFKASLDIQDWCIDWCGEKDYEG